AAAVQYAMAQVGDAYVYGAMGENAFDCSGLTMRAWAQAGVSLPHSSSAQAIALAEGPHAARLTQDPLMHSTPVKHFSNKHAVILARGKCAEVSNRCYPQNAAR
ncbi:MAG: NlpC/P60 family protein, partial [Actinomycetota bacterium]|nr:NlpC/P60 family protein [Actinomycetota bacterium]